MGELSGLIEKHWPSKQPLLVFGPYGCAKSAIVRQTSERIAQNKFPKRKFIDWADTTNEQKESIIENPEKYFVFTDQRISQMDSTDLRGIPNMMNKDMLQTVPYSWVIYFTKPEAAGFIFFDEINLAAPIVAGSAYQIILDRCISDRRLGSEVYICAAGNRQTDKAYTFDMPRPLKDRFTEVEITVDFDGWSAWASANGVSSHILAFLNWQNSWLYKTNEKGTDKDATPRGWTRASKLIEGYDVTSNDVHQLISISVGEAAASVFKAYCKHFKSINWDQIFKNPEMIKGWESDKMFAVTGGLVDQFAKEPKLDMFRKVLKVCEHMPTEFMVITLRMCWRTKPAEARECMKQAKEFKSLAEVFGKFVV